MANTYTLISSNIISTSSVSSVTFSAIPSTYTDLKVVGSLRANGAVNYASMEIAFNGTSSSTNWNRKQIEGGDGAINSYNATSSVAAYFPGNNLTANAFGVFEVYIPNYNVSAYKEINVDSAGEANSATNVYIDLMGEQWSNNAAITSITFTTSPNPWSLYSSFYLYGIKSL